MVAAAKAKGAQDSLELRSDSSNQKQKKLGKTAPTAKKLLKENAQCFEIFSASEKSSFSHGASSFSAKSRSAFGVGLTSDALLSLEIWVKLMRSKKFTRKVRKS